MKNKELLKICRNTGFLGPVFFRTKPKVFWRFQGVQKCDTGLKWVNSVLIRGNTDQRKPVLVNFWRRSEEDVRTFGILYFKNKIDCVVRKTLLCKKGVFKYFPKILRETLFRSLFIMKLQAVGLRFYWKEIRSRVFSWSFIKICKRTFL